MDQDLMMMEVRYKQHAEDFARINAYQIETGLIAKKDGPKVHRLFKLFCLKDRVFNAFINRPKSIVPVSIEKVATNTNNNAMKTDSHLKLPGFPDTEILMDDVSLSVINFMSRFEKFRVDEISIDKAGDDLCFNAKIFSTNHQQ